MNRLFGAPKQPPKTTQQTNAQPPPPQPKAELPEKNYDLSETSKRVFFISLLLLNHLKKDGKQSERTI